MPAGLLMVHQDREAASRRGTARQGGIVGAARTAFTVRVNADHRATLHARIQSGSRVGLPGGSGSRGSKAPGRV